MPSGIWIGICDRPWRFFCKSLVFGFVDADSFRYFDNIYDPQIKFISKYLRHIVIHCERPDHMPWILWGDIQDLSQILHYPGNDKCFHWQGELIVVYVMPPFSNWITKWLNIRRSPKNAASPLLDINIPFLYWITFRPLLKHNHRSAKYLHLSMVLPLNFH